MTTIIIEDEPLAAQHLERLLGEGAPELTVLATLPSVSAGIDYFARGAARPDLFFSDISLSDGLSFELFRRIDNARPIIFCTAYDSYALEAFTTYGIDYLLKPFDAADVQRALLKYRQLQTAPPVDFEKIQQLFTARVREEQSGGATFLIKRGERILPIPIERVALFYVRHGITYLYTFRGEQYALEGTLDAAEQRVTGDYFRLNRQCLIHRRAVEYVERYFARKLIVRPTVSVAEQLLVSKAKASQFLRWLGR